MVKRLEVQLQWELELVLWEDLDDEGWDLWLGGRQSCGFYSRCLLCVKTGGTKFPDSAVDLSDLGFANSWRILGSIDIVWS
jgi:hypothetical protein